MSCILKTIYLINLIFLEYFCNINASSIGQAEKRFWHFLSIGKIVICGGTILVLFLLILCSAG